LRVKKEAIDDDGEKQRAVHWCVSSVERESICAKERFGSFVFVQLDSPMSHIIFFPHPLFLSREEKRTKRFETSERAS
jgi:hypothetical protein